MHSIWWHSHRHIPAAEHDYTGRVPGLLTSHAASCTFLGTEPSRHVLTCCSTLTTACAMLT
jgi:hypothetical protein